MPTLGAPCIAFKFCRHLVCTKSKYSLEFKFGSSGLAYTIYNMSMMEYIEMELVVIAIELIEVIHGDVVVNVHAQTNACLICPTSSHILYCVATTA